jgi:hypothetical protein
LAWKLIEKLCTKFKPGDTITSAEQLEKPMKLTLKKMQDPEYLESKIASLETSYGCQIEEKVKIAAIVKAGAADIHRKMRSIKRAGGNVTSADLIQAMMESFRIGGILDSDKSDSNATEFKFVCNLCGKNRHKVKDCPQRDKIKCKHCGQSEHKKETCWKLEANQEAGVVD